MAKAPKKTGNIYATKKFAIDAEGIAEVSKTLGALESRVRHKIMRGALKKPIRRLWKATRSAAPHDTYALYKSFIWEIRTNPDKNYTVGAVGPAVRGSYKYYDAKGRRKSPSMYSWMVERGTVQRQTKKGARRGQVKALYFMQKTLESMASDLGNQYASEAAAKIKLFWGSQ